MINLIRTLVTMVQWSAEMIGRALVVGLAVVVFSAFVLNNGHAYAHGEAEPEPAKPADTKPAEPPLPPRPTEYPRGMNEKQKPGEAKKTPADKPTEEKPAAEAPGTIQPMPAPVEGSVPENGTKPEEGTIPRPGAAKAAWTPPKRYHFVMDTYTGLAMGGNDPVAFFVDGSARLGSGDHQMDWGGTTWHFVNDGNMAAFKLNPEVYAPRFGGRCAFALSKGMLVEGHPEFFLVYRDRLYLFANAGYRAAFLMNPDAIAAEAEREWPVLSRGEP